MLKNTVATGSILSPLILGIEHTTIIRLKRLNMRIQPNSDYVLIKQVEAPKKETTIILSSNIQETGLKPAKVLSCGVDVKNTKENTMVYPIWGDAKPVTIDGVEMALIKEESIIAYVTSLEG